ncbi:MAG: NUDIX hydrolase [Candidatus Eremiobacteraeota bacterium]|nr:NUDIX hydrolase [Candidatus Eremiobacteraeota bacterium]
MRHDPYRRLSKATIYENRWLSVEAHRIAHPNGEPGEHLVVVTPQACAVIAEDDGDLLFTSQPRFAARAYVVEIVKGGRMGTETPLESAQRELREELGVTARSWSALGSLHEIPSIVDPPVAVFVARELEYGPSQPSEAESITLVRLTIAEALAAASHGELDDAVTVAALFRFAAVAGYLRAPAKKQREQKHDGRGDERNAARQ